MLLSLQTPSWSHNHPPSATSTHLQLSSPCSAATHISSVPWASWVCNSAHRALSKSHQLERILEWNLCSSVAFWVIKTITLKPANVLSIFWQSWWVTMVFWEGAGAWRDVFLGEEQNEEDQNVTKQIPQHSDTQQTPQTCHNKGYIS